MNPLKFIFFVITISVTYLACTDNPFFKDSDFWSDQLSIKGTVQLIGVDSTRVIEDKSGVYVWLEGLDVSTYTRVDGRFNLQLSSPETLPGGATAWNGIYRLYYYLANYQYEYSNILIRNGKVEYGQSDVDNKGNIKKIIELTELLNIRTTISPCSTVSNTIFKQKVDLFLTTKNKPVRIKTFIPLNETSGCVIFKRVDAPSALSVFVLANNNSFGSIDIQGSTVWSMQLGGTNDMGIQNMDPIYIESGVYEVVPYCLIDQEGLPEELLYSISEYYDVFSYEYLKLPFKWDVDTFLVK